MERLRLARYDPVIYCYELQLHPSVHRKGLGKRLMQMLELVVSRVEACERTAVLRGLQRTAEAPPRHWSYLTVAVFPLEIILIDAYSQGAARA